MPPPGAARLLSHWCRTASGLTGDISRLTSYPCLPMLMSFYVPPSPHTVDYGGGTTAWAAGYPFVTSMTLEGEVVPAPSPPPPRCTTHAVACYALLCLVRQLLDPIPVTGFGPGVRVLCLLHKTAADPTFLLLDLLCSPSPPPPSPSPPPPSPSPPPPSPSPPPPRCAALCHAVLLAALRPRCIQTLTCCAVFASQNGC